MDQSNVPLTSEKISKMINTNPTVIRRTLAGLRKFGYVNSEKGHNGGWTLSKKLSEITLLNVYECIGEPDIFALGFSNSDETKCLIEISVNESLKKTLEESKKIILKRFSEITLDIIVKNIGNKNLIPHIFNI
jgi:DNA-binding IscR family transcriptional regulator